MVKVLFKGKSAVITGPRYQTTCGSHIIAKIRQGKKPILPKAAAADNLLAAHTALCLFLLL